MHKIKFKSLRPFNNIYYMLLTFLVLNDKITTTPFRCVLCMLSDVQPHITYSVSGPMTPVDCLDVRKQIHTNVFQCANCYIVMYVVLTGVRLYNPLDSIRINSQITNYNPIPHSLQKPSFVSPTQQLYIVFVLWSFEWKRKTQFLVL